MDNLKRLRESIKYTGKLLKKHAPPPIGKKGKATSKVAPNKLLRSTKVAPVTHRKRGGNKRKTRRGKKSRRFRKSKKILRRKKMKKKQKKKKN